MFPPPPIPVMAGLTTPSAKAVATAASIAFPPARRISAPISAESGCLAETMPVSPTASVFSISHVERDAIAAYLLARRWYPAVVMRLTAQEQAMLRVAHGAA